MTPLTNAAVAIGPWATAVSGQYHQVHDCPHGSAKQHPDEHPLRTQHSDASARKDINRRDYQRDGEMQDEAETRTCKPAREGPCTQQTACDVLQYLDRVLAVQAQEDDAIGCIKHSNYQRRIEDGTRDGQRPRCRTRLTPRVGVGAKVVICLPAPSALSPESR